MAPRRLTCLAWTGSHQPRKAGRRFHGKATGACPDRPCNPAGAEPCPDLLARHTGRRLDAGSVRFRHHTIEVGLRLRHDGAEPGPGAVPGLRDRGWRAPAAIAAPSVAPTRRP